jgi:hypothetical protein
MMNRIERSKESFKKNAEKLLVSQGVDPQTVDLESEFDDHMKAGENLDVFRDKMTENGVVKPEIDPERIRQDQMESDLLAENELRRRLAEVKLPKKITVFYSDIYEIVEKMKMDLTHLAFIKGIAGIGKCLSPETGIYTPTGIKRIDEIKIGEYVLGFNEDTKEIEPTKVIQTQTVKATNLITIKILGRAIKCSEEHRFYTRRGWTSAKDLNTKDIVYVYGRAEPDIRGMGVYSWDNRRGRFGYDCSLQAETSSGQKRDVCSFEGTNRHNEHGQRIDILDKGKIQPQICKDNAPYEEYKNLSSADICGESKGDGKSAFFDRKDTSLYESEDKTITCDEKFLYAKEWNKSQRGEIETLHGRGHKILLGIEKAELIPTPILEISRESQKNVTLFDIATTFSNFLADGILTHNSYHLKIALAKQGLKVVVAKKVSEPYIYRLLFENNHEDVVIWVQDAARFFRQQEMIEFLKGVTETDPADRIATNYTYSKDNADLPKHFLWEGKLLFDYNNMVNLKFLDDYNALISRGEFVELVFSRDEMSQIMRSVAKTKEERAVTEFLIKNHMFVNNNFFNLRTQQKAFMDYKYAVRKKLDWRKYLMKKLRTNRTQIQSLLYQKMGDGPIDKVELIKWLVRSGNAGSERTASRHIDEWLRMEEIYNISGTNYNPLLSLRSKDQIDGENYIG